MKVVWLICRRCGYEGRIQVYSREEAEARRMRLAPPTCPRCGTRDVELHD